MNAICPGAVFGDRMKRVIEAKAKSLAIKEEIIKKDYESMTSLKTFVAKKDVSNMAVFLLSDQRLKRFQAK